MPPAHIAASKIVERARIVGLNLRLPLHSRRSRRVQKLKSRFVYAIGQVIATVLDTESVAEEYAADQGAGEGFGVIHWPVLAAPNSPCQRPAAIWLSRPDIGLSAVPISIESHSAAR